MPTGRKENQITREMRTNVAGGNTLPPNGPPRRVLEGRPTFARYVSTMFSYNNN